MPVSPHCTHSNPAPSASVSSPFWMEGVPSEVRVRDKGRQAATGVTQLGEGGNDREKEEKEISSLFFNIATPYPALKNLGKDM